MSGGGCGLQSRLLPLSHTDYSPASRACITLHLAQGCNLHVTAGPNPRFLGINKKEVSIGAVPGRGAPFLHLWLLEGHRLFFSEVLVFFPQK